jgi:hypothetical protein
MIKTTFHVTARRVVAIIVAVLLGGCAQTIIAREKPLLSCSTGDDMIPIAHHRGSFKWQCGRPPTKCDAGQVSKFFVASNRGESESNGIRWECLRAEKQRDFDALGVPGRKLDGRVHGKAMAATLSGAAHCRRAWLDSRNVVRDAESWQPCGREPIEGEVITVNVGASTLRAVTNADGKATFDLTGVKPTESLISNPTVQLLVLGNVMTMVSGSADLTKCELFPLWKDAVKLGADTERVDQIELDLVAIEVALTRLEGARDPWGDKELEEAVSVRTLFNDMRRNIAALEESKPLEPVLERRLTPLASKVRVLGSRAQALVPSARKAAEARKMSEATFLNAFLSAGASSGFVGGSASLSTSDVQLKQIEESHRRERADDERRRQLERDSDERKRGARDEDQQRRAERCRQGCGDFTCYQNCNGAEQRGDHACRAACDTKIAICKADCPK